MQQIKSPVQQMLRTNKQRPNSWQIGPTNLVYQPEKPCQTCAGMGFLRYDVQVTDAKFGQSLRCPDCNSQADFRRLQSDSQLEGDLLTMTFDNFAINQESRPMYEAFQRHLSQRFGWLVVHGNYGGGKTHLQAALVNEAIRLGLPATYFTLADLLDWLRGGYGQDSFDTRMKRVGQIGILCIDECGRADLSKNWAEEKFQQLIGARYRRINTAVTVWVTNRNPRDIRSVDNYLISRLSDEAATEINYQGRDNRKIATRLKRMALGVLDSVREQLTE